MMSDMTPPPIDYRELLCKYIDFVGNYEGTDFLDRAAPYVRAPRHQFTDDEWAELQTLGDEVANHE